MTTFLAAKASPIEVWLSKANLDITCSIVQEDETAEELSIDSLSIRGAEREITAYLLNHGYTPAGRWQTEADNGNGAVEVSRAFKVKP